MNKVIALALSVILMVSLAACSGSTNEGSINQSDNTGTSNNVSGNSAEDISLSGEIGGEITISTYDTMQYKAFLDDAARLFMEQYPGAVVNVETFSAMPEIKTSEVSGGGRMSVMQATDDPQGRQDYINKINTALMSGEGADILAMDVLPIHKYADGGQLLNLAPYMEADPEFSSSDYRENILDAIEYKGGTWFLPMDYTFDYYAYDSTLLAESASSGFGTNTAVTIEELVALAQSDFDGSSKLLNTPDYMKGIGAGTWGSLLAEHYASFVDVENKRLSTPIPICSTALCPT